MTMKHPANVPNPYVVVNREVIAHRTIEQCPLDDAPDVPRGRRGAVEDFDSATDLYAVDFGDPYGVVLCSPEEIS